MNKITYFLIKIIKNENKYNEEDDDEGMNEGFYNNSRNKRRKPQYLGGLIFEPHPGLYDDIILVMDYTSLYPSIIQKYNISFETVIRKASQNFKEENNWNNNTKMNKEKNNDDKSVDGETGYEIEEIIKKDEEEYDEIKPVEIKDKIRFKKPFATLPSILKYLDSERRNVKNQLKIEKDKFISSLLEIKQKSLKTSANSLNKYLRNKNSRFYSKEIAILIEKIGRRSLRNVSYIIGKFGYKIIYGDSDSVMVNIMTQNIKEALEIWEKINKEINKKYKLLIIEIEDIFKSVLLMKKKDMFA